MTYCLAISHDDGIIFASDSRTNAGVDYVTSYTKMHVFQPLNDRIIVLLSAGNLATTQEVLDTLNLHLAQNILPNLASVTSMPEAVQYVGQVSQQVQNRHLNALNRYGFSGDTTFILGGQIGNQDHGIYMIYPQGNYIKASKQTPYLQIGESKYGKPILDRTANCNYSLDDYARIALVSLDATIQSNISVGLPIDLAIYKKDSLVLDNKNSYDESTPNYREITQSWKNQLSGAIFNLPKFDWEK